MTPYIDLYDNLNANFSYANYAVAAYYDDDFFDIEGEADILDDGDALDKMLSTALDFDKIKAARGFCVDGEYVLALISLPIYLKSERLALIDEIATAITLKLDITPVVLLDTDLYRRISDNLGDDKKRELLAIAKSRANNKQT